MGMYSPWRALAAAIRLGDLAAADRVLDGFDGARAEEVSFGRADADKKLQRDAPLLPLAESQDVEIGRIRERKAAEAEARLQEDARSKERARQRRASAGNLAKTLKPATQGA